MKHFVTVTLLAVILLTGCSYVVQATPAQVAEWQARYHPEMAATVAPELLPTVTPAIALCIVKGNISSSGEKIYHVPGGASYGQTIIDTAKGERCFDTEQDAIDAGWRKAAR